MKKIWNFFVEKNWKVVSLTVHEAIHKSSLMWHPPPYAIIIYIFGTKALKKLACFSVSTHCISIIQLKLLKCGRIHTACVVLGAHWKIFLPQEVFFKFYLFIYLGCAGSSLLHGFFFSNCSEQGLLSSCSPQASLWGNFSLLLSRGSRIHRLQ